MKSPCSDADLICFSKTLRGAWATGLPSIIQFAATQATSRFQGSWIAECASGTANISGCAGLMSSQVAKPANPAPSFCISDIASAGTNFAL